MRRGLLLLTVDVDDLELVSILLDIILVKVLEFLQQFGKLPSRRLDCKQAAGVVLFVIIEVSSRLQRSSGQQR